MIKMKKNISRRKFLADAAILGTVSFMPPPGIKQFPAQENNPNDPDMVVVKGPAYYANTLNAIERLGGMKKFVSGNAQVALLINSPWNKPGTYTHPDIVLAVVSMCYEAGAKEIFLIKNAGSSYFNRSKLAGKFTEEIRSLQYDGEQTRVNIPRGKQLREAEISKKLLENDVLINLPISKHHAGTNFTGNLKNMMGASPYSTNRYFHNGGETPEDPWFLAQCIADLNLVKKPDLCISDLTELVTTNGPAGPGELIRPQKIVAGTDPVAVDAMASSIMGHKKGEILMIRQAYLQGAGKMNLNELNIEEIVF